MENPRQNLKRKLLINEFLSSSTSSEEEFQYLMIAENLAPPQKRAKISNYVSEVVPEYTEEQFREHFRVNRKTFKILTSHFKRSRYFPKNTRGKKRLNARTHILSFLWYIGNKCVIRDVADRFGVSKSTQHEMLTRTINFFILLAPSVIKFPATEQEKQELAAKFEEISGFPGVNGCIDGCYIDIRTPKNKLRSTYTNRHDKTSLTLQGICDEKKRFLDVFTGISSKIHDSRVFKLSFIYQRATSLGPNYHLLGDAAYPLKINLMTPYRDYGNLTDVQRNFNFKFSSTRVVIENSFGILKNRFRQLMKLENLTVLRMSKIIIAACVVHNICIDANDGFWADYGFEEANDNVLVHDENGNEEREEVITKRDNIAMYLFEN